MTALEIVKFKHKGTNIISENLKGYKTCSHYSLDCCEDPDDGNCAIESYCEDGED